VKKPYRLGKDLGFIQEIEPQQTVPFQRKAPGAYQIAVGRFAHKGGEAAVSMATDGTGKTVAPKY